MSEKIQNRHEILFLYDIKDANPNGDPSDENKPRIDEETGTNIVTDVRLKRTVRDYLSDCKGLEIFVKEVRKDDGKLKTKDDRLGDLEVNSAEDLVKKCIDIRLFGATAAIKKKTITLTGPVQFRFGRSLHKVSLSYIKGTTVMPSKEEKGQGTFTEIYILPYSLLAFYGIVNENSGKETHLTEGDIDLLMEGLWEGTKNLISRSKFGQMPRLLLDIQYQKPHYHTGDLDKLLQIETSLSGEAIRDIGEVTLNLKALGERLQKEKENILQIRWKADERIQTDPEKISQLWNGITSTELSF